MPAKSKAEIELDLQAWFIEQTQGPAADAMRLALDIALALELQRQSRGWTYAELSRRMGVSRAYIQRLAQGNENSTLVSLCKLAAALDCALEIKLTPRAAEPEAAAQPAPLAGPDQAPAPDKPAGKRRRKS